MCPVAFLPPFPSPTVTLSRFLLTGMHTREGEHCLLLFTITPSESTHFLQVSCFVCRWVRFRFVFETHFHYLPIWWSHLLAVRDRGTVYTGCGMCKYLRGQDMGYFHMHGFKVNVENEKNLNIIWWSVWHPEKASGTSIFYRLHLAKYSRIFVFSPSYTLFSLSLSPPSYIYTFLTKIFLLFLRL